MKSLKSIFCFTIIAIIFIVSVAVIAPTHAQSSTGFFAGKTITMLAGSSPGGGTDQTVRLIARHMERYIPGKPTVLVVNKPGAGGLIAVNELYNLRKPDGLTMSNINTGALFAVAGGIWLSPTSSAASTRSSWPSCPCRAGQSSGARSA